MTIPITNKDAQLTPEEYTELFDLIDKRFGPRPTDPNALHTWKMSRFGYLYMLGPVALSRLRKEVK